MVWFLRDYSVLRYSGHALAALCFLLPLSCERPPTSAPSAAPDTASKPAASYPLQSTAVALVEMDAMLAAPRTDPSTVFERVEIWAQVADASAAAPADEAALRSRIGRLLVRAGRPDQAIAYLRRSIQLQTPESVPATGAVPCVPDSAVLAEALLVVGASFEAEQVLRAALGPIAVPGPQPLPTTQPVLPPTTLGAAYLLAEILRANNRPHEAIPLAEAVLAGRTSQSGPAPEEALLSRIQVARVLGGAARVNDAFESLEQIHKECLDAYGADHWLTAQASLAFGESETRIGGRVKTGFERVSTAATRLLAALPPTSWLRVDGLNRGADLLESRRHWTQSESLLRASLAALDSDTRPMPPAFVPRARLALARNLVRQKQLDQAQQLVDSAVQTLRGIEARLPDADEALADGLLVSCDIARRRKQFPQAHQLCNEAQELRTLLAAGDVESPGVALCRVQRGRVMLAEDDFTGAEEELKDAVPLLRRRLGEMDWRAGLGRLILGEVRYRQMRLEEAEEDIVYGTRIVLGRRGADDDGLAALRLCVDLYETWANTEMANHYRRMLPESHAHDETDPGE